MVCSFSMSAAVASGTVPANNRLTHKKAPARESLRWIAGVDLLQHCSVLEWTKANETAVIRKDLAVASKSAFLTLNACLIVVPHILPSATDLHRRRQDGSKAM